MKKILIIASALLVMSLNAMAEDSNPVKFDLRIGIGGAPVAGASYFSGSNSYSNTLESIYGAYRGPVKTTGVFSADMGILFKKWLAMDICLGVCPFWAENFDGRTDALVGKENGVAVYLMPKIRFTFLNREYVRLYANIGIGMGKYFGFKELQYSYSSSYGRKYVDNSFKLEAQVVPLGIEFGRRLFGFCEFGVGTMYMGATAGIGYKF